MSFLDDAQQAADEAVKQLGDSIPEEPQELPPLGVVTGDEITIKSETESKEGGETAHPAEGMAEEGIEIISET